MRCFDLQKQKCQLRAEQEGEETSIPAQAVALVVTSGSIDRAGEKDVRCLYPVTMS